MAHSFESDHASAPAEAGMSLVEVLVGTLILSLAFIGVLGGMTTMTVSSAMERSQSDVGAVVRSAADDVKSGSFIPCGNFTSSPPYASSIPSQLSSYPENNPLTLVQVPAVVRVTSFAGTVLWPLSAQAVAACSSSPGQAEVIDVQAVATVGGASQTIDVTKASNQP